MTLNLEDFRRVFEEQLLMQLPSQDVNFREGATQLLQKRKEIQNMDVRLKTQREEFDVKKEILRQRRGELKKKEEKLKECLLQFDKFLKDNDTKRTRGLRKADVERAAVRQREQELQRLQRDSTALLDRREKLQARVNRTVTYRHYLESVVKMSRKFEDITDLLGRFDTLETNLQQLVKQQNTAERERESKGQELRRYVTDQGSVLLQHNHTLSLLQTELDKAVTQALKWETTWNHIQSTAAKETLLLGQIKVGTLNLYYMTGGATDGPEGVDVDDTLNQLDRIRVFMRDITDIVRDFKSDLKSQNGVQTRSITN